MRSLEQKIALFLALSSIPGLVRAKKELCSDDLRSKVIIGEIGGDGSLKVLDDGAVDVTYPEGTFWQEGKHWWTCPCLLGKCIRQCIRKLAEDYHLNITSQPAQISIWDGENQKTVLMSKHFHIVEEGQCRHAGYFLEDDIPQDEFRILINGSLYLTHDNERVQVYIDEFCVIPLQDSLKPAVYICVDHLENEGGGLKFSVYPIFFILSIIFLLLTLAAFFLTPDHNSVHARSVICQAGSLLITYVGLTINYLTGDSSHEILCITTAYITHFFLLASFFWLNVMCIDIYFTCSGQPNSTIKRTLLKFSVYAWCSPLVISIITILLDRTTAHEQFSPGIGKHNCWFKSIWSQLIYFGGPVLILLLFNTYLFGATALRLRRMLDSEDSPSKYNEQNKDRLWMYVKFFLLMGGTWFMEIVSLLVGGPPELWYIPDAINGLRGVFIFWFCVWSNKTIRQQLSNRYWPTQENRIATNMALSPMAINVESSSKETD